MTTLQNQKENSVTGMKTSDPYSIKNKQKPTHVVGFLFCGIPVRIYWRKSSIPRAILLSSFMALDKKTHCTTMSITKVSLRGWI